MSALLRSRARMRLRACGSCAAADAGLQCRKVIGQSLALVLLGLLLSLRALAYASPPDPTWIAGFWDDDDYDDVVLLVTSTASTPATVVANALEPHWAPIWILPVSDDRAMPAPPLPRHHPRGPPLF